MRNSRHRGLEHSVAVQVLFCIELVNSCNRANHKSNFCMRTAQLVYSGTCSIWSKVLRTAVTGQYVQAIKQG